jgi:hypothetical protein
VSWCKGWAPWRLAAVCGAILALCLLPAFPSRADTIVGSCDWNAYTASWTNEYGDHTWTTMNIMTNGGHPGGRLDITFPSTSNSELQEDEWYDVVHMSATNLFAGPWRTDMAVQFDFWASNAPPHALAVQWQSSENPNIWSYVLTPPAAQAWTRMEAPLQNWQDWWYTGATEDQFLADLATIDWIGVYMERGTADEQRYGFDNVGLMVPEPAEWVMLAAALLTATAGIRRRKTGMDPSPTISS